HRRECVFRRHVERAAASGARPARLRRGGRAGEHQRRSDAAGREFPEDAAPLMPTINYTIVATTVVTFVLAYAVVHIAHALVQRLVAALDIVSSENRAAVQARARKLLRALMLMAYGVAALASVSFALARFGFGEPRWDPRAIARWFVTHG